MAVKRRMGTTTSKTRTVLLEMTLEIMQEEGYAAVSSRNVAGRAGLKAPLVHYYFETLDDLFIAALHHRSDRMLERLTTALEAENPLPAIWDYVNDKAGAALTIEFLALANHRKAISAEIAEVAERFRKVEVEAVSRFLVEADVDVEAYPAAGLLFVLTAVPTLVGIESQLNMSLGHQEALDLVERQLAEFTQPRRQKSRPPLLKRRKG